MKMWRRFSVVVALVLAIGLLLIARATSVSAHALADVPTGPQQTATAAACATAAQFWLDAGSTTSCDSSYGGPGVPTSTPDYSCSAPDGPVTPCPTPTPSPTPCISGLLYVNCPTATPTVPTSTPTNTPIPGAPPYDCQQADNLIGHCVFNSSASYSAGASASWVYAGAAHQDTTDTVPPAQSGWGQGSVDGANFYNDLSGGFFIGGTYRVRFLYVNQDAHVVYTIGHACSGSVSLPVNTGEIDTTCTSSQTGGGLSIGDTVGGGTGPSQQAWITDVYVQCISGCGTSTPTATSTPVYSWPTSTPTLTGTPAPTGTVTPTGTGIVVPTEESMPTPVAYCDWYCTITQAGCSLLCPGPLTGDIDPLATAVTAKWGGSSVVAVETALPSTGQTACGSRLALNLPTGIQFGSSPPLSATWHLCPSQESNQALVAIDNILPEGRAFLFMLIAWRLLVWSVRYVRNWFRPTADDGGDA